MGSGWLRYFKLLSPNAVKSVVFATRGLGILSQICFIIKGLVRALGIASSGSVERDAFT